MKLTNYLRDSFVIAVMNDVPEIQFPTPDEVQDMVYKKFPPKLKAVYNDEELQKGLLREYYAEHDSRRTYVCVAHLSLKDVLAPIYEKRKMRDVAQTKVKVLAYSCSTLKQLQDAAPDLLKYMPSEDGTVKRANLPAVTGVKEALTEAGFPKDSKGTKCLK